MLSAKLVVVGGEAKAAEIPLKLPTIIGRGREVNLTLPHPLVSRQHCELFERGGKLLVRDLKSLNGTYVDNRRITASEVLNPDQLLTIGNVTFRAVYQVQYTGEDIDTEVQAQAETVQTDSSRSVIEIEETAAADADSRIDPLDEEDSIHSRPTQPGNKQAAAEIHETAGERSLPADGSHDEACVIGTDQSGQSSNQPQHSVCAAMIDAGVASGAPTDATLSEIQRQLPESHPGAASHIDPITVHDDDQIAPKVGESFAGFDEDEEPDKSVHPEESALGSFIRRLPR